MAAGIVVLIVGIIFIVLSIITMTGNISLLHSYHRKNVTEENKKAFGRLVGIGLLIIALGLCASGVLNILADAFTSTVLATIGYILMSIALVIGLAIAFIAMKIYNKGIF